MLIPHDTVKDPRDSEATVWDYAALESLQEFQQVVSDATMIVALDTGTNGHAIVFGAEVLNAIANKALPTQRMVVARFALDFQSDYVEHLCAATQVTKGFYEWPSLS